MEKQVNEKIELLEYQQFEKGIVVSGRNQIPILNVAIQGIEDPSHKWGAESAPVEQLNDCEYKKIESLQTSYASFHTPIECVKKEAAHIIAGKLIDKGFLSSTIEGNIITFSINCFGLD